MKVSPIKDSQVSFGKKKSEKNLNKEYEKQKAKAEERRKEEELKAKVNWEALINKPQTYKYKLGR